MSFSSNRARGSHEKPGYIKNWEEESWVFLYDTQITYETSFLKISLSQEYNKIKKKNSKEDNTAMPTTKNRLVRNLW